MVTTVTVGADPEVFCWPGAAKQKIWARCGEFGPDGAGFPTGEFRPNPSEDPAEVVENLRKLIRRFASYSFRSFRSAVALAVPFAGRRPIGGHIHLGLPYKVGKYTQLASHIVNALVAFAGPLMRAAEPPYYGAARRIFSPYGEWTGFRTQPHGIEWRFPSFWIAHPDHALAALTLAKTVTEIALAVAERDDKLSARAIVNLSTIVQRYIGFRCPPTDYPVLIGNAIASRVGYAEQYQHAVDLMTSLPAINPFRNIVLNWCDTIVIVDVGSELTATERRRVRKMLKDIGQRSGAAVVALYERYARLGHNIAIPDADITTANDGIVGIGVETDSDPVAVCQEAKVMRDLSVVLPSQLWR